MVRLTKLIAKRRRYVIHHEYKLLRLSLGESAKVEVRHTDNAAERDVLPYRFRVLQTVPLEKSVLYASLTSSRKERATVLNEAMRFILAPLITCSDTEFEVSLKDGMVWRCFLKFVLYRCDIPRFKKVRLLLDMEEETLLLREVCSQF